MIFLYANGIAPDGTSHFAPLHLGLFCLPMSHKKDARLSWVMMHILTFTHFQGAWFYAILTSVSG